MTDAILALTGRPRDLVRYVTDRPGHDRRYALDAGALRATGWAPRWTFEDGLAATVEWYREHARLVGGREERRVSRLLPARCTATACAMRRRRHGSGRRMTRAR